jgi:cell division protein FtsB
MTPEVKKIWNSKYFKQLIDARNIVLYIFALIVLAITWSGVKTVQKNYELQKKIAEIKQQNTVTDLQNQNTDLQNKYLQTDEYLELAARQNLGLAAPGEKVLIVPKDTAMKYVDSSLSKSSSSTTSSKPDDHRSRYAKNLEAWRDFLLGRKSTED